ncbi:PAS domain S-box protein [Psychroflexus montanilacus]|uniref:PAS domain S-box protein n=1 Tax=Psychroflexus montanilacus TaxID=2873598 RepID=UPI001CCDEE85|nr:PAS domain S-box protein [Psychroflexus montanilacus]MBZ9652980.1 PAS domain S-box protein [Psychroflexus montanilacus]
MEKDRLKALYNYKIIDSEKDKSFDRLAKIAAIVCDCSYAHISFIDDKRLWIKSSYNHDKKEFSRENTFCNLTIDNPEKLKVIPDVDREKDPKIIKASQNNPSVKFYAGKSIVDDEGYALGTICVFDSKPKDLTKDQKEILDQLSEEVMDKIIAHKERLELKELNESISDGKSRFQTLLNNTGDMVFLLDSNYKFIEFYGREDNLLVDKSSFIGQHLDNLEIDKKLVYQLKLAVKASKLYNSSIPVEYDLNRNGTQKWFSMNVTVIQRENFESEILCVIRDVTDRKKAEKNLKLINNLFNEAESLARVGGWRYDVNKEELFWTPILKDIAEIDGHIQPTIDEAKNFFKDGKSLEKINQKVIECIKFNTSYTGEFEALTAKKKPIWALVNIKPEIVDGECIGVYGSFQDITEIKNTKEKLKKERGRLNDIINATNLGTWEWNVQTGEAVFNNRFVDMLGYTTREIPLVNSIEVWNKATHPDDLRKSDLKLQEHFEGKTEFYQIELRLKHRLGHWIWVLDKGKVISWTDDGKPEWMFGTHQDISDKKALEKELKQNVQQFKNIFELSPIGIVITDFASGEFLDVNKAMQDMIGYDEEEILGMSIWTITPEKQITQTDSKQINYLKDLKKIGPLERVIRTKSGKLLTVVINGLIHFDKNGKRIVISTLQDVTEQKRIEKKLKNSKTEAVKASQAKSEFVANMSHEIRTPLNGVIGFSDLLMKTPLNEVQHQYMKTVFQSANILLDLINDVLDFSKIESGKLQLDTAKTSLLSIVEEVADLTKYEAHKKGLELILIVEEKVPDYVWIDGVRIKQILMNLINNSIKFTNKGFVKLSISFKSKANHLSNLIFSVEDSGIGIAKENQKKIFNAFIQEDTSVTKKYGGTGLGLAISDKILNLMNSKLRLKSKIGQGSKFYFEVALQSEYNKEKEIQNIDNFKNILVISTVKEHFETIKNHLKSFDVKINYVKNLDSASTKMTDISPEVIFINQECSIDESCHLVSRLKTHSKSKNVRFVLLSRSNSTEEYEEKNFLKHFDQLITKPIKKGDLMQVFSDEKLNLSTSQENKLELEILEETAHLKFLVAEDNLINMELIKSYLKNIYSDVEIFEAEDGHKAFSLFKKHQPDIIFSDIQMPNMNGYELTRAIRAEKNGKTVPIIAITAGTVKGTKEKCLEAGMDDYISKPILQESIRNIILKFSIKISEKSIEPQTKEKESEIKKKDEPGAFEKEHLMEMIGHNEMFFNELIKLADETLNETLIDLMEVEEEDTLKKLAHKVKGTALNLGATSLSDCALKIEKSKIKNKKEFESQKQKLSNEIKNLIDSLPVLT